MFKVGIRTHIMIAHSLPHVFFGPAQNMHGATYVVDVIFKSEYLDKHNVVIDIGQAHQIAEKVCAQLNYKNLDEKEEFKGMLTTTEFLAKYIYDEVKKEVSGFFEGKIEVILGESHIAWASYEA